MQAVQVAKVSLLNMVEPVVSQEIYIKREYNADDRSSNFTPEDEKESLVHR